MCVCVCALCVVVGRQPVHVLDLFFVSADGAARKGLSAALPLDPCRRSMEQADKKGPTGAASADASAPRSMQLLREAGRKRPSMDYVDVLKSAEI